MFYQKRTSSETMLTQTRSLYGLRNFQNLVPSNSYNFYLMCSIIVLQIIFISHLTLLLSVLSDEDDIWHDALSDSQLVRASELVDPGTFSFILSLVLCLNSVICGGSVRCLATVGLESNFSPHIMQMY